LEINQELLGDIQKARELTRAVSINTATYYKLTGPPFNGLILAIGLLLWLYFTYIYLQKNDIEIQMFGALLQMISERDSYFMYSRFDVIYMISKMVTALAWSLVYVGSYTLLIRPLNALIRMLKLMKNRHIIEDLKRQIAQDVEALGRTIIPLDYQSDSKLAKIESYVRNNRADTLRDCINMYEEEMRHNQLRRSSNY
jgi:hypothetical protein